jgi:hypothetical protein
VVGVMSADDGCETKEENALVLPSPTMTVSPSAVTEGIPCTCTRANWGRFCGWRTLGVWAGGGAADTPLTVGMAWGLA